MSGDQEQISMLKDKITVLRWALLGFAAFAAAVGLLIGGLDQ